MPFFFLFIVLNIITGLYGSQWSSADGYSAHHPERQPFYMGFMEVDEEENLIVPPFEDYKNKIGSVFMCPPITLNDCYLSIQKIYEQNYKEGRSFYIHHQFDNFQTIQQAILRGLAHPNEYAYYTDALMIEIKKFNPFLYERINEKLPSSALSYVPETYLCALAIYAMLLHDKIFEETLEEIFSENLRENGSNEAFLLHSIKFLEPIDIVSLVEAIFLKSFQNINPFELTNTFIEARRNAFSGGALENIKADTRLKIVHISNYFEHACAHLLSLKIFKILEENDSPPLFLFNQRYKYALLNLFEEWGFSINPLTFNE